MATGQTLLTIASIILLSIITMGISQLYLQSVVETVDSQIKSDALNFGRDLADELHVHAYTFGVLDDKFGIYNDVSSEESRIEFTSQVGRTFYATIELSPLKVLIHNELGRQASIKVFEKKNDSYRMIVEYETSISSL